MIPAIKTKRGKQDKDQIRHVLGAPAAEPERIKPAQADLDLKVYKQNRKLRLEHERLTEEIELLSTRNVNLVFQLKETEEALDRSRLEVGRALRLEGELARARQRIASLEALVIELKEEYLTNTRTEVETARETVSLSALVCGTPYELLLAHLRGPLGAMAASLLEQVYRRCEAEQDTTDHEQLGAVLGRLETTCPRLARNEQEKLLLDDTLTSCRRMLLEKRPDAAPPRVSSRTGTTAPLPEPQVELEPETSVEGEPYRLEAEPDEQPEPEMRPEAEVRLPVTDTADGQPKPEVLERTLETTEEVPAAAPPDPGPSERLESSQVNEFLRNLLRATKPEPTPEPPAKQPLSGELQPVRDRGLMQQVRCGQQLLMDGRNAEALTHFEELENQHPNDLGVVLGWFHSLAAARRWSAAHQVGSRLVGRVNAEASKDFREAMTGVLKERLQELKSAADKKTILLELAEVNLPEPQQALRYLRQAELLPDRIPGGGRIHYHLCCLLEGTSEDRTPYLLGYMRALSNRREVFEHIHSVFREEQNRGARPVANVVLSLATRCRAEAERKEVRAGRCMQSRQPDRNLLARAGTPVESSVVKFCLDHLLPSSGVPLRPACPTFTKRLNSSSPAPQDSPVTRELRQAADLLGLGGLDVRRCSEGESFLLDGGQAEETTVVFHRDLEDLPPSERRFLAYRKLLQLQRRHLDLYRCAQNLDKRSRYRLVKTYMEMFRNAGSPIPDELVAELTSLPGQPRQFDERLREILDRLHQETRSDAFRDLKEFLFAQRPFSEHLDRVADRFASAVSGLTAASYALARNYLGKAAVMERAEREGLQVLYERPDDDLAGLRSRLQWLWADRLQAAC